MAKGDRDEKRIDEQAMQSQSYLTMLQQQLANQTGGMTNMFSGGFPQQGNVYGWGSTVPHYSPYGPIFQGNGTDTPVNTGSYSSGGYQPSQDTAVPRGYPSGSTQNPQQVGSGQSAGASASDIERRIMPILAKYGGASSESLQRALPEIQAMFPGTRPDSSGGPLDELVIPGLGVVDFITNAEGAGPKNWSFQTSGGSPAGYSSAGGAEQAGGFGGAGGVVGRNLGDYNNIFNRFSQFADTGGYSEADKANIRSRAVSPIRSIYSSAEQGLERQRSLQGSYSPGFATARARMAREQGQLTSDATTNAEASIAQMVNQGKQFGVSGMNQAYSSTPGLSNMFGNQMLTSQGQQLQAAGLQNQLGLGLISGQTDAAKTGGVNWGAIAKGVGTAASIAAMFSSREFKDDIKEVNNQDILEKLKNLKIHTWKYKNDNKTHIGPMAEDFQEAFNLGDGVTITYIDAIGILLASVKALSERIDSNA